MVRLVFILSVLLIVSCTQKKELTDEEMVQLIFDEATGKTSENDYSYLTQNSPERLSVCTKAINSKDFAYENLRYLTSHFTKRLACYPQGIEAAKWTKSVMGKLHLDTVFLQQIDVMNWKRGAEEIGAIKSRGRAINVNVCALGRGISTPGKGLEAKVIEVNGIEDLENFTRKQVEGKIVFFNKAMNPA